jgi:hypothetical protein
MRSDLLCNHLDVIGNLHHTSSMHWRFSTKLSFSICMQGSLFGMPQGLVIFSSYAYLFNFSREHSLHSSNVELQLMDVVDDIMTQVEISLVY